MKIAISAESTIDLPENLLKKYNIHTVPFGIFLGEELKLDGQISSTVIFDYVQRTGILPKTSAVNTGQYEEHFSSLLKEHDAIVHISLSSEMSSAFSNAKTVADEMKNVYVVDSRTLSTGIALLAIYASKLAEKGEDAKTIAEKIQERTPSVQASFVLKKLNYLYKGGRCSGLQLFGANLLNLRPQIKVIDGKMAPDKKYRGPMDKVIREYCEDTLKRYDDMDLEVGFVTYTTTSEDIVKMAVQLMKESGFKDVFVTTAGGTISSHCGEDTLGILFMTNKK